MSSGAPGTEAPKHGGEEEIPRVDVNERGGKGPDGQPQTMNARLFMQLLVFDAKDPEEAQKKLASKLKKRDVKAVVYQDANSPSGVAVLSYAEDPAVFVRDVAPAVNAVEGLEQRRDFTMLGRTYSQGHEQDLKFWLIDRPQKVVEEAASVWHVWYPLRRSGAFAKLEGREQASILREHAIIGRAYGAQDLAHDVRLACHGLDAADNEFIVGLIGKDLHPLSHVVQAMRKTRQTSEFIAQMGPFFVGYVVARTTE